MAQKIYFVIQIVLRILAIVTTAAAASLMFANHQTIVAFCIEIEARYNYSPAFKFFAYANIVGLVLSVLSLVVAYILGIRKAVNPTNYFYLFLHDLIVTVLLMAGFAAAAAAIGYVGKYGNINSGWMPVCDHFGKFCHRTVASLVMGFLGVITYLILTVVSANKSRQIEAKV